MIVVLGFMKAAPGEADRLHDAMTAMITESEKEEGCIRYVFSCMAGDPDSLVLTEIWRDQEALDGSFPHPPHGRIQRRSRRRETLRRQRKAI